MTNNSPTALSKRIALRLAVAVHNYTVYFQDIMHKVHLAGVYMQSKKTI